MHKIVSSVPYERSGKFARGIQFMVRRISILFRTFPSHSNVANQQFASQLSSEQDFLFRKP